MNQVEVLHGRGSNQRPLDITAGEAPPLWRSHFISFVELFPRGTVKLYENSCKERVSVCLCV